MSNAFPSLSHTPQAFPLPSIPEDTLHYTLHLPPTNAKEQDASALALLITEYVESLLIQPWLWNRDSWELKVISQAGELDGGVEGGRLEGRMRVGDAVDDEWLVVYLLRQVSKKWPELIIGIRDTDGEFLLIEAANVLPSWVTPENSTNRLWLQNGNLHLIPLSIRSTPPKARQIPDEEDEERFDPDAWLSEKDALGAVRTGKYRTEELERAVWKRIDGYPDALKTHIHHTKAWLPVSIAKALKTSPELVQRAVEGFYVRDPSQLRAASRMTHFPPCPSVLSPVLLTRAAYAQLQGQVFHPPRVFGPEWHVAESTGEGGDKGVEDEKRWRDLGVKISTGFEIMYKEGGKRGRSGLGTNMAEKESEEYRNFLGSLTKAGFFHGELQGSAKWTEREAEAFKGWKSARSSDIAPERPSFAFQVDKAIDTSSAPTSDLEAGPSYKEDDDSWLEVSPDDVDALLAERSGRPSTRSDGAQVEEVEEGDERGQALSELAKKVESFVGGKGDVDGATFADELSDEDMGDSDDEDELEDTKEAREEKMKNLVVPLPAEEWGRKPQSAVDGTGRKVKFDDPNDKNGDKPIKMRPPIFAPQEYDGVIYESDDDSDDEPARQGSVGQVLGDMNWQATRPKLEEISDDEEDEADEDGVDNKKSSGRSRKFGLGDDIDEQMKKAVWGSTDTPNAEIEMEDEEEDIDFGVIMEEEQGDFLKFAQEALGITDDMMQGIVSSREARGAFVPTVKPTSTSDSASKTENTTSAKRPPVSNTPTPPVQPERTGSGEVDMSLDSFDKVMEAMDAELAKAKSAKRPKGPETTKPAPPKGKNTGFTTGISAPTDKSQPLPKLPTEEDLDDLDEDDLEAMDRELKAALKSAGIDSDDEDEDGEGGIEEVGQLDDEGKREYRMMKDFLESYKSQGGNSGVVGNLFGRLGEKK